jgi:hypothetical protein
MTTMTMVTTSSRAVFIVLALCLPPLAFAQPTHPGGGYAARQVSTKNRNPNNKPNEIEKKILSLTLKRVI